MEFTALARHFFGNFFQQTPWFVSPISVPCGPCAKYDSPYKPVPNCRNYCDSGRYCSEEATKEPHRIPKFKKHDEASSIQLFYDLFFVANLSTWTTNHEIIDSSSLVSYTGFFALLWFTWFGTIIFDVRFAIDSWFTRLGKACSFGIMTAFAMTTLDYSPNDPNHFRHEMQMVSLILMASRLFLVMEYGAILIAVYYRHRDNSVIKPFALTICTSLVAALVFWGLSRTEPSKQPYGYIGWYITSAVEAAVLLIISHLDSCDMMKFDETNIVERMGALTLVIMGEGIIGMTESVSLILKTSAQISAPSVGLVITVVMIIYVLWMLYFDHTDRLDHPSTRINKKKPWCQIWAFLHFPLHTAILLTLEGSARLMVWWNAYEAMDFVYSILDVGYGQNGSQVNKQIQLQLYSITEQYPFLNTTITNSDFQSNITELTKLGTLNCSTNPDCEAWDIMDFMGDALVSAVCERLDIGDPSSKNQEVEITQAFTIFEIWFIAFFVAAGCVLIFLALARYFGHQNMPLPESIAELKPGASARRSPVAWVAITLQCLIGIGLALFSLFTLPAYYGTFTISPWVIPTVLLAFSFGKLLSLKGLSLWLTISRIVIVCDNALHHWCPSTSYLWSSDVLHPPVSERLAVKHCACCSKSLEPSNDFALESKRQVLKSSSPDQRQFDGMSARTAYSSVIELPLLKPSLSSNTRDFDAISVRTERSRLPGDPEGGYGA